MDPNAHPIMGDRAFVAFDSNGAPVSARSGAMIFESEGLASRAAKDHANRAPDGTSIVVFALCARKGFVARPNETDRAPKIPTGKLPGPEAVHRHGDGPIDAELVARLAADEEAAAEIPAEGEETGEGTEEGEPSAGDPSENGAAGAT
jgi:hypothetical protein